MSLPPASSPWLRRLAALGVGVTALALTAGPAGASTAGSPAAVSVGVGGAGPASATYTGGPVTGNDDPLGPPAPQCGSGQCDRETVHLAEPAGFTGANAVSLSATLTFTQGATSSGDTYDIGVLDASGALLASASGVGSPATVTAKDVPAGDYTIEVDGDIATGSDTFSAAVSASSVPRAPLPVLPGGGLSFSRETVADPFRLGTEPNIAIGPDGKTTYESPIFGFSTTQSFLQRSLDGGRTFNTLSLVPGVGKLDQCTGGGDSDLATDQFTGDIYMIDLGGAPEVPARVSHDKGNTFASSCEANFHDGANYFTDRQWLSTDTVNHLQYFVYRDGLLTPPATGAVGGVDASRQAYGEYIKTAPLATSAGTAAAPQITFTNLCTNAAGLATPCITDVQIAGNVVSDNATGRSRYAGTSYLALQRAGMGVSVAAIDPTTKTVTERSVPGNHQQVLFPTVAVDRAGTIYLAWVDASTFQVQLASSKDQGRTWSPVQTIQGAPVATAIMPWVVAGDAGRVDVVFYGSAKTAAPTTNSGPWFAYLAQSLNADAGSTGGTPAFSLAQMTDRPNHIDPICLSGLGCTTNTGPAGDRELGDFFRVALDNDGRAVVSFADGDNQLGQEVAGGPQAAPSFAHLVRQATGPSLLASVGTVPAVDVPTSAVTVGAHDNPVPLVTPGTGQPGANVDGLNLLGSATRVDPDGTVHVHLQLKKLDLTGAVTPPALPTATYLTRWVYKDQVFFAAAEDTAGQLRYFAGPAAPVTDGAAIKYASYPASAAATGKADPATNSIDITVPASSVGRPVGSPTLFSVTSYALTQSAPTPPTPPSASNGFDFPQIADVLPAYNTAPADAGASPVVPETPFGPLLPLSAVAVLAAAVLLTRRRRRTLA